MSRKSQKMKYCIGAVSFIVVLAAVFMVLVYGTTMHVAFYGIPDKQAEELSAQIKDVRRKHIRFISIPAGRPLPKGASWKYDMLFLENGKQAEKLAGRAVPVDEKLFGLVPSATARSCIIDGKRYALPLLVDDYEIAYYRTYRNMAGLAVPQTFSELDQYLTSVKPYAEFPLMCAGRNDEDLCALVSSIVESQCGTEGYSTLIHLMTSGMTFQECRSAELGKDQSGAAVTLASVLDTVRDWQNKGLMHPRWFEASEQDVQTFMGDHRTGAVFMSLGCRRLKPSQLLMYYDADRFPINPSVRNHALIARVTCAMLFKDTEENRYIFKKLISQDTQSRLSTISMLGPASARSEAHDRQADNARFYAASCPGGPVSSIACAVYADPGKQAAFAADIRRYLAQ